MPFAELRALHAVIGQAIDEIEKVYKSQSPPLEYPALDAPYYSSQTHSPEVDKAEELKLDPAVFSAANQIVAACGQLTATVHKPFFQLVEVMNGPNITALFHFVEQTHIPEILREAGPAGLSTKGIAAKIAEYREATGAPKIDIDPAKIGHILRLMATYHWVREVTPDVFANNRLTSFIDSGKSLEQLKAAPQKKYDETDGVAAFVGMSGDEVFKLMSRLTEWLNNGGLTTNATNGLALGLAFNTPLKYYEWLEEPGNEWRLTRFGHAMNGTRYWEVAENIIHGFPWDELPKDSVVVDIGGGIGSVSVILSQAYPHLRFVVEDRAPVVGIAREAWGSKHAELFDSGRVTYHAQDFFDEHQPFEVPGVGKVSQPSVFLARAVAHNWPDKDVKVILSILRRAAGPHTKLLWVDNLLPYACIDDKADLNSSSQGAVRSLVPEGSPLLPNLGKASANGYILDVSMLGLFDAKERTYREMDALAQSAGWKIINVKRAVGSLWAYTTAVPI
ncbi:S-adenosyl-L-methionine-dependent methyltransferase [Trametes coccinea BRFM310]|uniref:S-adenosyl-L-methionine-dependent methyltransferase n=1 Tax=Trametes coccinea (strain BRFM310) TaxID=1353009 RepID=A0A1Y2I587_TRAC3|nr:S-adenosyl-L-methionine-dependent methyltransferase [Trametes coccinea BRFM310]